MTYGKIIGLAAIAATALMAFVGVSSASATTFCKTNESASCASGWNYPASTRIAGSLENGTSMGFYTTSIALENTCTSSTLEGTTNSVGGAGQVIVVSVNSLSFANCSNTIDVLELGELQFGGIEGTTNATVTAKKFRVTMNLHGVSCTYGAGTGMVLGILTGGSMATLDGEMVMTKQEGGFLCPETLVWLAKYTITAPEPLYIAGS